MLTCANAQSSKLSISGLASMIVELFGEVKLKQLSQVLHDFEVVLVVYGPPASGKDTLLKVLELLTDVPVISMGKELRARESQFPEINSGGLAKTDDFLDLLDEILSSQKSPTFSIAGSPRKVDEARTIVHRVKWVVEIKAPLEKCRDNMLSRIQATESKGLKARKDDSVETLPRRYSLYQQQTQPVIDFFKEANKPYLEINGNQSLSTMTIEFFRKLFESTGVIN